MSKMTNEQAQAALQAGVMAKELAGYSKETTPKHLRVGVNIAMCEHAALLGLLLVKGLIKRSEYETARQEALNHEIEQYEASLSKHFGKPVKLSVDEKTGHGVVLYWDGRKVQEL